MAVAAVAGAAAIAAAIEQERSRVQQTERECARAQVAAEQQRHQAELTAEREQAAQREAELRQQVAALTTRAEEASARERAAASRVAILIHDAETLHQRLEDEADRIWIMHFELASLRGAVVDARALCNRNYEAFVAESAQRQHVELQLAEESKQRKQITSQLRAPIKTYCGPRPLRQSSVTAGRPLTPPSLLPGFLATVLLGALSRAPLLRRRADQRSLPAVRQVHPD